MGWITALLACALCHRLQTLHPHISEMPYKGRLYLKGMFEFHLLELDVVVAYSKITLATRPTIM